MADESVRNFHRNFCILPLFFIEGANVIDDNDERWSLFSLYFSV